MKKILATFTAALVLSLTACSGNAGTSSEKPIPSDTDISESQASDTANIETSPAETMQHTDSILKYMTFEECLSSATHIVIAEYTGEYIKDGFYKHFKFTVKEQLKGSIDEENIMIVYDDATVHVENGSGFYRNPHFEKGESYIFPLTKAVMVYWDYDRYMPFGANIIISDTEASIYSEPIKSHSSGCPPMDTGRNIEAYSEYIKNYLKENPSEPAAQDKLEFIRSDDIKVITEGSESVVRVVPLEYFDFGKGGPNHTDRITCEVKEVLKSSEIPKDIKKLNIVFKTDTVEMGSEYVVLLAKYLWSDEYYLSSKHSVYPITDTENVDAITKLCQKQS